MNKRRLLPRLIPVVSAGAVAHPGIANGELVPNVVLDTSQHPDVEEMLRIHQYTDGGEAQTQWGHLATDRRMVVLAIEMKRPAEVSFTLAFDLRKYSSTIDRLLQCKVIYLQAGSLAARNVDLSANRIFLEIGGKGLEPKKWEKLLIGHWRNVLRKQGMSTKDAEKAARSQLAAWRQLTTMSMGGLSGAGSPEG